MKGARLPDVLGWRVGRFLVLLLGMVTIVSLGAYQVQQRHRLIRIGYNLDHERLEHQRLLEMNKRLNLALSTRKDPTQVRRFAQERLGMRPARQTDEFRVPVVETPEKPEKQEGVVREP